MAFSGFKDARKTFFTELAKNPSREWFQANKERYETEWAAPMLALLTDVAARIDAAYPYTELLPPKVFRIYRDVRFSKDKTPYKTNISGIISVKGAGGMMANPAAIYIQIGLGAETFAAAGHYQMPPDRLLKFRKAIVDPMRGKDVANILKKLEKAGFEIDASESLKKVPRGFEPTHPLAQVLKMKGLVARFPKLPDIASPNFATFLVKACKQVEPLVTWTTRAGA